MTPAVLKAIRLEYATSTTPLFQICQKYELDYDQTRTLADKEKWDQERREWQRGKKLPESALPPMNVTIPAPNAVFRAHLESNLLFYHNQSPVLRRILDGLTAALESEKSPIELQRLSSAYQRILEAYRTINGIMAPGFTKKTHKPAKALPGGPMGDEIERIDFTEMRDPDDESAQKAKPAVAEDDFEDPEST